MDLVSRGGVGGKLKLGGHVAHCVTARNRVTRPTGRRGIGRFIKARWMKGRVDVPSAAAGVSAEEIAMVQTRTGAAKHADIWRLTNAMAGVGVSTNATLLPKPSTNTHVHVSHLKRRPGSTAVKGRGEKCRRKNTVSPHCYHFQCLNRFPLVSPCGSATRLDKSRTELFKAASRHAGFGGFRLDTVFS